MAREEECCVICWDKVDIGRLPELAGKGEAMERARGEAGQEMVRVNGCRHYMCTGCLL